MTTSETTVEFKTADLRNALTAVLPHAEKHVTGDNSVEHRVRVQLRETEALVMATNGYTSGISRVPYAETAPIELAAEPWTVDITPRQVKLALNQFKIGRGSGDEMNEVVEFIATLKDLTIRDVGGLMAGEAALWPVMDVAASYPDLPAIVGQALAAAGADPISKPLVSEGALLALFRPASVAYGAPLDFRSSGSHESRGYVAACGPWFVGTVSSRHDDDHWRRQRDASHRTWLGVLGIAPKPGDDLDGAAAALGDDDELVEA